MDVRLNSVVESGRLRLNRAMLVNGRGALGLARLHADLSLFRAHIVYIERPELADLNALPIKYLNTKLE
jgi:hypothetical protein